MKTYFKGRWSFVIILVCIFLLFVASKIISRKLPNHVPVTTATVIRSPVRLIIPSININAEVEQVGVTQKGEMAVPRNGMNVGWFKLGPYPGEKGSAVISGHMNGTKGEAGIFVNLHKLKKGDKLSIIDTMGKSIVFVVREKRMLDPGYADDVFKMSEKSYLNLITCEGVWDAAKKSYSKRLVVFAQRVSL